MESQEEKIFDLISTKSFDELTSEERNIVLNELRTEDAYTQLRETHLAAAEAMNENIITPPSMKRPVMEAFDESNSKKSSLLWWRYAALIAGVALGTYFLLPTNTELQDEMIAENIERKDSSSEDVMAESPKEISSPKVSPKKEDKNPNNGNTLPPVEAEDNKTFTNEKMPPVLPERPNEKNSKTQVTVNEQVESDKEWVAEMRDLSFLEESIPAETEELVDSRGTLAPEESVEQDVPFMTSTFASPQKNLAQSSPNIFLKESKEKAETITLLDIGGIDQKAYVAY